MTNALLQILLAEDNQDDATLFRMALDKANVPAKLQIVSDGEEAVAYLKGEGKYSDRTDHPLPDVLLLDLNMPRKNGFEVLEWIRGNTIYKHLTVHVLTASGREEDVRRVFDLRANSYAIKPSRMSDLVAFNHGLVTWHSFLRLPRL